MKRLMLAALLALVTGFTVGCGSNPDHDGPRLANADQTDPRLKAIGTGPAVKAGGVVARVNGKTK